MSNINMDLTASLANYREIGQIFRIYKFNQRVNFEAVVFVETIEVYLISSGISTIKLELGTDYIIPDYYLNECDNDMSNAKMVDPDFEKELTIGIEMIRPVVGNFTISVTYQKLYPNQITTAYYHHSPLNVSPELMLDLVKSVEQLKITTSSVTDVSSLTQGAIILPLDESKKNSNNYIEHEEHIINVPGSRFVIHPKGGSFYRDSVTVYHPSTNITLVEGTDYLIYGMDEARTKATSYPLPVYNFILIITPIVDLVEISYHAFGGEVTADNYQDILKQMNNVIQYLNDANNVTNETLGSTEVIKSIISRIEITEANVRRLQGTPAYGDITTGKTTLMKLFSDTPGLHWYTIASLYLIEGLNVTPSTADTFTCRMQTATSRFQVQLSASTDLFNVEGDRFNVNVLSENYQRGYQPFVDYTDIDTIINPHLRIVWLDSPTASGAYLQLGFELKGMLEETIVIEDMSGQESCWKLVDEIATATTPSDNHIVLPSGSIWVNTNEAARSESMLIPFIKGTLVWAGMQQMNAVDGWQHFEVSTDEGLLLDNSTNIRKIKKLRVDIEEEGGFQYPIDVNFNSGTENLKGHATFIHQEQPVYLNAEIYRNAENKITVRLNYDVTAGIEALKLNIRDLVIYL